MNTDDARPRHDRACGMESPASSPTDLWRSLEEREHPSAFEDMLGRELPGDADLLNAPIKRRTALQLMAASLAFGGLGGCGRPPREEIMPYVHAPERVVPGVPAHYATALTHGGFANGVLVTSHMGRPTKVEGNPSHPASCGGTDIFAQAAVLGLYDPDRSQAVRNGGQFSDWEAFAADVGRTRVALAARGGAGLYVLTGTVTSPTLGRQLRELLRLFPEARWHQFEAVSRDCVRQGAQWAFGEAVESHYHFGQAEVVLSLDSDFLGRAPDNVRQAREFADRRRTRNGQSLANRLYVLESAPTLTGAMADRRWSASAGQIELTTRWLAQKLGIGVSVPEAPPRALGLWLDAVAADLREHAGRSLVVPGDHQAASVHALVHAMNERLGAFGKTVTHRDPAEVEPVAQAESLNRLVADMRAGRVDLLFILGGNPVYDAPADIGFADALTMHVPLRIHWGLYADETAALCHWHIPALHELESWSDARARDGAVTILQPLTAPLYGGHSVHELLAWINDADTRSDYEIVRAYWRERYSGPDFDAFWRRSLRDGLVADSTLPPRRLAVRADLATALPPAALPDGSLEIQFRPAYAVWDGRYANNAWLQELPDPLSKLTWDNPVWISPVTAARFGLRNGQYVELVYRGRALTAPVWIMPGHADGTITLHLGYGRTQAGRVGSGVGADVNALRTSAAPWSDYGLSVRLPETGAAWFARSGEPRFAALPTTQQHHTIHGRDLVQVVAPEALVRRGAATPAEALPKSLYAAYPETGNAWGMVIDLNVCTGCSACVIACQAENNIPVVGRDEVLRGREMHWLRVDRYYAGTPDNPTVHFQPVPCMHCQNAPCEPVCPVHASVHDSEGLNDQVYNRCVGTRFCQSNCPYKVRRFNFYEYARAPATNEGAPIMAALRNPDVTVRSRGVMEKCTYCVQRISAARIEAEKDGRPIRDGDVVTACQAVCPTRAIVFGNISDPDSAVARLRKEPQHYALLAELGTRPRTTYLAKVRNLDTEADDD